MAVASDYDVTDTAAALISAGDSVIEDLGVTRCDFCVTWRCVSGFSADVDLNAYNAGRISTNDVRGTSR